MSLALQNRDTFSALSDQQVYRLLFAATFIPFLATTAAMRLFRLAQGGARPNRDRQSVFAEAKATAYITLALAFTG